MVHDFHFDFGEIADTLYLQSREPLETVNPELDGQAVDDCEILTFIRSDFRTTPVSERHPVSLPPWGARYSILLCNIPWFCFQDITKIHPFTSRILSPASPSLSPRLGNISLASADGRNLLLGLIPSNSNLSEREVAVKLSSIVETLVPERFGGEASQKLDQLLDPLKKCSNIQIAEFFLYFVSNNAVTMKGMDCFFEFITKDEPRELFRQLFRMKTPTVQAISIKLLETIARRGNEWILQDLLDTATDRSCLAGAKGGRLLQIATFYKQAGMVQILLRSGADVNPNLELKDSVLRYPALFHAASNGDVNMTKCLLNAGAQVNRQANGHTALEKAILAKCSDCIRLLLEAGADVDSCEVYGTNALDWAFVNDYSAIFRMLLPFSQKAKTSTTVSGVISAAKKGVRTLAAYLKNKEDVNKSSQEETLESALVYAANYPYHMGAIPALLDFGVDPEVPTFDSYVEDELTSPLEAAARVNDINLAELLLDAGADINTPNTLAAAAEDEHNFEFLNFLIEMGADIELLGAEALAAAIMGSNLAAIELLLRSGASIHESDNEGFFPVQQAAYYERLKILEYIVRAGGDVNAPPNRKDGYTALHYAVVAGNTEIVNFLIHSGAHVKCQQQTSVGKTLLETCAEGRYGNFASKHSEIFKLLLNSGAEINGPQKRKRHKHNWNSALTTLIIRNAKNELILLALDAGADVNQTGWGRCARTPIQAAAEMGNVDLIKELLGRGADINAPAAVHNGRTTLQAACSPENVKLELIEFLLSNGADINAKAGIDGGLTALQGASIGGHIKIALLLIDAGADVNADAALKNGRMALDGAAEHGRLDMVQLLLNAGARSEEEGGSGYDRAIELAEENGHYAIVELLKNFSGSDAV